MSSEAPKPSLSDEKLAAEIDKLRAENAQLRTSAWSTPVFIVPAVALLVSLVANAGQFWTAREAATDATRKFELAESQWKTQKPNTDADTAHNKATTNQIEVSATEDSPAFSVDYVTMRDTIFERLALERIPTNAKFAHDRSFSRFSGLELYQNDLYKGVAHGGISEPSFSEVEFRGEGDLTSLKKRANHIRSEQRVTCLVLRLEGKRRVRNAWLDARQIQIPGAASLPQTLFSHSPTAVLLQNFEKEARAVRIGLGDILPGKGYIIPIFVSVGDGDDHIAFGTAFVPLSIKFTDSGDKNQDEVSRPIRAMEPHPFKFENGMVDAG